MIYVITGESRITDQEADVVAEAIAGLEDVNALVTGGARGVDSIAALTGLRYHEQAFHLLCLPHPRVQFNDRLVGIFARGIEDGLDCQIQRARAGYNGSETYMIRNGLMARNAAALGRDWDEEVVVVAFPYTEQELIRSGTWATVRRCRELGCGEQIHALR